MILFYATILQVTGKVYLLEQILPLYPPLNVQWLVNVQTLLASIKNAYLSPIPILHKDRITFLLPCFVHDISKLCFSRHHQNIQI